MGENDAEYFRMVALKKFEEISSVVCDDRLREKYGRKEDKVDWIKMRQILKNEIFEGITDTWNEMWEQECLTEKLGTLSKLKENANKISISWRPKTGDIEHQRNFLQKQFLLAQRDYLTKIALEKEEKLAYLKEQLTEKWKFYEDTSVQIENCRNENELMCLEINDHLENTKI